MRKNLKNARQKIQLTQAELAEKLDITLQHYQRLEAGTSEGSVKVWSRLKEILGTSSIDYLLKQEDTTKV